MTPDLGKGGVRQREDTGNQGHVPCVCHHFGAHPRHRGHIRRRSLVPRGNQTGTRACRGASGCPEERPAHDTGILARSHSCDETHAVESGRHTAAKGRRQIVRRSSAHHRHTKGCLCSTKYGGFLPFLTVPVYIIIPYI